jgi:hypothetical protein
MVYSTLPPIVDGSVLVVMLRFAVFASKEYYLMSKSLVVSESKQVGVAVMPKAYIRVGTLPGLNLGRATSCLSFLTIFLPVQAYSTVF